jgi:hypothetical protein
MNTIRRSSRRAAVKGTTAVMNDHVVEFHQPVRTYGST